MHLPVLIGSQALKQRGHDIGRVPADWDIIVSQEWWDHMIESFPSRDRRSEKVWRVLHNHAVLEIKVATPGTTDQTILEACHRNKQYKVKTPIGLALVPSRGILKAVKIASLPTQKDKHRRDLELLKEVSLDTFEEQLALSRRQETLVRIVKEEFFYKYKIQRFIDHDQIHEWVAAGAWHQSPAYSSVIEEVVRPVEEHYTNNREQGLIAIAEEAIVLAIERWFFPAIYKGANSIDLWERLIHNRTSDSPAIRFLDRQASGQIKDRPQWQEEFCRVNYDEIKEIMITWLEGLESNMPKEFWIFVQDLRLKKIDPIQFEKE